MRIQPVWSLSCSDISSLDLPHLPDTEPCDEPLDNNGNLSPDDGTAQIDNMLPETWEEWPIALKRLLSIPMVPPNNDLAALKVATLCSGTDGPVASLDELLGTGGYRHIYSFDHWRPAQAFICANFKPDHVYGDVEHLLSTTGSPCCVCNKPDCKGYMEEVDMLVMGFPCKPYSSLNLSRWLEGYDPYEHPEAKPLFALVKFLKREDTTKPKVIILEMWQGCCNPSRTRSWPGIIKHPWITSSTAPASALSTASESFTSMA